MLRKRSKQGPLPLRLKLPNATKPMRAFVPRASGSADARRDSAPQWKLAHASSTSPTASRRRGVPLAALISGANVPDAAMLSKVLDAVVMRGPRGPRRPGHLCLDKGYDYPHVAPAIRLRGIRPHIRRRGEQPPVGKVSGKARRWVVERTNSWHKRFRGLLVRWERLGSHYLALLQFACGLIAFQQAI